MTKYYYGSNYVFYMVVGSDVYYFSLDKEWTRHGNISLDKLLYAYKYMKMQIKEVPSKWVKLHGVPL